MNIISQQNNFFKVGETKKAKALVDLSLGDFGTQIPKGCEIEVKCISENVFYVYKNDKYCFSTYPKKDNGFYYQFNQ